MKAKVVKNFHDRVENVYRKSGETFTVSAERFAEINATKYGVLVEEVKTKRAKKTDEAKAEPITTDEEPEAEIKED